MAGHNKLQGVSDPGHRRRPRAPSCDPAEGWQIREGGRVQASFEDRPDLGGGGALLREGGRSSSHAAGSARRAQNQRPAVILIVADLASLREESDPVMGQGR